LNALTAGTAGRALPMVESGGRGVVDPALFA
jgi:hypothetical protein